jgi:integrase/recombinase XerD
MSGHRVLKSMNTTDWDVAQELEKQWIAGHDAALEIAASTPPPTVPNPAPLTLEEGWQRFIAQAEVRKLHSATIYKYRLLRRQMSNFAASRRIQYLKDFDLELLEAFQSEGTEGPLTSLRKLGRVRAFFRFASERRWIHNNPARLLRGPKVRPRPTLPFSPEEMGAILSAVGRYPDKARKLGRPNAVRLRAFILTLRYTGLRIGDVTSLSVDRLVGNRILLYTQKTGQPVNCVLPVFVAEALENAPRLSDRYFFWTGNSTLHTAIGSWQRTLRKLFKLAGVRGTAHCFRDTFAVELLLAGVSTEEVAVLLGHSNIGVTQKHYSPWVHSRQRQLEANLERAWNRDPIVLLNEKTSLKPSDVGGLPN